MSIRKQKRKLTHWETETRQWATDVLLRSSGASTTSKIQPDRAVLQVISWPVHHSSFSALRRLCHDA
jgi:hypothetical protein